MIALGKPFRTSWGAGAAVAAAALVFGPVSAARAQDPPPPAAVTDEGVETAIQKAVTWILDQRREGGHWQKDENRSDLHWGGDTALAVLSLLYAGQDPRRDVMAESLNWLAAQDLNGTYAYGTRAHALALVPGRTYRSRLQADLDWLLDACYTRDTPLAGAYDYRAVADERTSGRWDNSVTQFGVLGVWMAAEAGLEVPAWYWDAVARHYLRTQLTDGGWTYMESDDESYGSMAAAGLATLYVALDQLYASRPADAAPIVAGIERGLDWFGREYGPVNPHGEARFHHYYLYGVERVGRASGRKYFRDKDWFRTGAADLLSRQKPDGSWPDQGSDMDAQRATAFALMFLCHGRAPLLFNKLEHGAAWDGKLRDAAGLTRYATRAFERLLNWQIVRLDGTMEDLMEAPVLYLYSEGGDPFGPVEVQKLREYCQRGGLFFCVAGNEDAARAWDDLARRALPEFTPRPLPADHPLLSGAVQFPIADPPPLVEVHNGVRTLMLLCRKDLADTWNRYAIRGKSELDFQLGCNIYLYATDKTTVRSRLETPNIPLQEVEIRRTIRVARIRYDGRWDVEPYGWTRLRNHMNNETATRLLVTSGIPFDSSALDDFKIAYVTGADAFELSEAEQTGLRRFLSGGGTLLADAAGGSRAFAEAFERYVRDALRIDPRLLREDEYLITGTGIPDAVSLAEIQYRRTARTAGRGRAYPQLQAFAGRRRIITVLSPLDLSASLLGTQIYDLRGYEGDSTLRILRNLLLYADLSSAEKSRLERER